MRSRNFIFPLSGIICLGYIAYALIQRVEIDDTFWIALITAFMCLGAWFYYRQESKA